MPTPNEILAGLTRIANEWFWLAVAWHVYFGALALALGVGWRPLKRTAGLIAALPLFSVSALAWIERNPFNGGVFAVSGLALAGIALLMPRERIDLARSWTVVAAFAMIAFGWIYPHFLETEAYFEYAYAAPVGLVPCPTLAAVIGFALLFEGLSSRGWTLVLVLMGLFYGAFGAIRLGVSLDWGLLAGALILGWRVARPVKQKV